MSKHSRITWRSNPHVPTGFPMAAVVWMPDGPALATVTRLARVEPPLYVGWIGGMAVTGHHDKMAACRAAVAASVAMAHEAAARRRRDAHA